MDERRILVVANQTAAGDHVKREVKRRMDEGPCRFTLVVPATLPKEGMTYTEGEALDLAETRMQEAVIGLREIGATVKGVIGDPNPMQAIDDDLRKSQ